MSVTKAQEKAIRKAYRKLQMPPMVPLNKQEIEIIDENVEMIGFTKSNYVFTDISYNVSDRVSLIFTLKKKKRMWRNYRC